MRRFGAGQDDALSSGLVVGRPVNPERGGMRRRIEIMDYDPSWPDRYTAERDRLANIFEPILESIHHVGSTSVPGLGAKPVIDLLIVVMDDSHLSVFDLAMIALGYTPRGECLDAGGTPGRYYYSKNTDGIRTHQVHICKAGHFQIAEILAFRRYLREHPETASAYERLKVKAATENRYDIVGYMKMKDAFIKSITQKAVDSYKGIQLL